MTRFLWKRLHDNPGQLISAWELGTRAGIATMTARINVKDKYNVSLGGHSTIVSNWEDADSWVVNTTNQILKQRAEKSPVPEVNPGEHSVH